MVDSLSVPRRSYDFEDYLDIVRRNLHWLIAPAFLGLIISTVVAFTKEDVFWSEARIRVVPQQLAPDLVASITSQDVADRINSMAQNILSRNTLEGLINTYGLYKKELRSTPMTDVVDTMRQAIGIRPTEGVASSGRMLPAMLVGFAYPDRYVAQKVCADLVTRFMNSSTQEAIESTSEVGAFLGEEFTNAKKDLDQAEQKLQDFRKQNAGRMPEEMQMNMSQMNALGGRLESLNTAAGRLTEQRMMLESEMRIAKDRLSMIQTPQLQSYNDRLNSYDREIESLESSIAAMKERYTDDYPDLQGARDRLAFLKRQKEDAAKKAPKEESADAAGTRTRDRVEAQHAVDALQVQLKTNTMEAQQVQRDIASVNAALRSYQARLQGLPAGEKEYYDLIRDRDLARQKYLDADAKRQRSSVAIRLEQRKQGQTLELLDAASLPTTPAAPKRGKIVPIGAVIGLGLGIVIVAIREFKDTSLKNLKDARLYTQLSILGSIPLLENDVVVQRRKQVMWLGWASATIVGIAVMAGTVAHYYLGRG